MATEETKSVGDTGTIGDITYNLQSLQFENALQEEEKSLVILRQRSHALTVTACAQATYFVSLLNEARQVKVQLKSPHGNKMSKLLQDGLVRDPLHVGVIGCGRLGGHLVDCLLTYGEIQPDEMVISSRRPETLRNFRDLGVHCVFDNREVAKFAHMLFICVLPSQLPAIAEEIKSYVSPSTLIYSFTSSISASKVARLLNNKNVLRPLFDWDDGYQGEGVKWEAKDVQEVLCNQDALVKTCPLHIDSNEKVLRPNEKFAEALVYAFVNMCTSLGLTASEVTKVVNGVILDEKEDQLQTSLVPDDISKVTLRDKTFPIFHLADVISRETPLTKKLIHNQLIRRHFIAKYLDVFRSYIQWNAQNSSQK